MYESIRGHIVTLRGCKTGSKVIWLLYVVSTLCFIVRRGADSFHSVATGWYAFQDVLCMNTYLTRNLARILRLLNLVLPATYHRYILTSISITAKALSQYYRILPRHHAWTPYSLQLPDIIHSASHCRVIDCIMHSNIILQVSHPHKPSPVPSRHLRMHSFFIAPYSKPMPLASVPSHRPFVIAPHICACNISS